MHLFLNVFQFPGHLGPVAGKCVETGRTKVRPSRLISWVMEYTFDFPVMGPLGFIEVFFEVFDEVRDKVLDLVKGFDAVSTPEHGLWRHRLFRIRKMGTVGIIAAAVMLFVMVAKMIASMVRLVTIGAAPKT